MRKLGVGLLSLSLLSLISIPSTFALAQKPVPCKKPGAIKIDKSTKYVCTKSGGRLLWKLQKSKAPNPNSKISPAVPIQTKVDAPPPQSNPEAPVPESKIPKMFPELTPSSRFRNISECQLKQTFSNYFGTGFGYPRPSFRLKSIGTVKTLLLYVEFTDVKGNDDPIADAQSFIPNFVEFFRANSYEKLNFVVDTHPNYLPINKSSTSYNMDKWGGGNPFQYWKDGLQAGDSVLDVSKYDLVIVMPPKNITTIIYGPSFPLPPQDSTGRVKNGVIYNGAVGGADQRNAATKWIWLAHEVGHDLGMEHPYSRDGEVIWDLMSNVYNFTAPEFLGWHRLRLDWLDGSNVKCLSSEDLKDSEYNVRLLPIQSKEKGDKLTLVKIDNSKALAIESRRMAGFDTLDGNKNLAGVIVYLVDVSKDSNQNAFSFITGSVKRFASGDRLSGALHVGESLTFDKIKVEFLASDETTDYISLSQ